ncbi:winged helix-turn-helix transcriptional regulator [Parasphingorhabdus sp.]|uniref:winged helix-turn-helix transcriptional regulator n=1 Tax=Parasphingorhabdus sp. TaxID=2709688 RepID=UPI003D2AC27D
MTRKSLKHLNCGWAQAAEAIGDKWSIMILRDAFIGVKTFSAFADSLSISRNILTQRLDHLIDHDVLGKRPIGIGSARHEYYLTEKGNALLPIMMALYQWSDEWVFGKGNEPYVVIDRDSREPIDRIIISSGGKRDLTMADLTIVAGEGANENNQCVVEAIAQQDHLS